jgi:hypothetical protein
MAGSFHASEVDQSTLQLVVDQIEELLVTVIEEVRERPAVAVALLAAVVGAIIGSMVAARGGRKRSAPRKVARRVGKQVGGVGDVADLAGIGLKLLENPVVRNYARAAIMSQLKKRIP